MFINIYKCLYKFELGDTNVWMLVLWKGYFFYLGRSIFESGESGGYEYLKINCVLPYLTMVLHNTTHASLSDLGNLAKPSRIGSLLDVQLQLTVDEIIDCLSCCPLIWEHYFDLKS